MKKSMSILLLALFAAGCAGDEPVVPAVGTGKYITVAVDVPSTRGTPVTSASQIVDIGLFCSYTGKNNWNATSVTDWACNSKMVRNASNGLWEFDGAAIDWNAGISVADNYTFFAYAPYNTYANGILPLASTFAGIPRLGYTVPANVRNQPDLMVAVPKKDLHPTGHPVALHMKHALAAVGFKVKGNGRKITGIAISGIKAYGELAMDGDNIAWSNLQNGGSSGGYSASIAFDAGQNYFTADGTERYLLTGDGYLMMIPQQLGANAVITMTFADGTHMDFSLDTLEWHAGRRTIYNIDITVV